MARSHGAIFCECNCVFLSHAIGCVEVNDTVHMVQLQWIFVCNIAHEWVPHTHSVRFAMCDSKYNDIYVSIHRHTNCSLTM